MTATVGSEEFDVEATERARSLSAYGLARRSERERERQRRGTPVVRTPYAMSDTDIVYVAMPFSVLTWLMLCSLCGRYAMSGTDIACVAM
eukprot:2786037-Rhodomonas_salina.1